MASKAIYNRLVEYDRSIQTQLRALPRGACYPAAMAALYDRIGRGYADFRRPDPRIEKAIWDALGEARSVINVGAGAGSYEPTDRHVVAVEPSLTMIAQRPAGSAAAVQATADSLPFENDGFDAAMAILSVHHWRDRAKGLRELRRVASDRVVVLTCDPESRGFWLTDYFPELFEIDRRIFPSVGDFERELGPVTVRKVPVPHDCTDGFLGSCWRRPHDYLDERVRGAMSTFAKLSDRETGLAQLSADLESGNWQRKYGALLKEAELDIGYRLLVAGA